jgi:mannose-6-phosphate isomerase-like protein (cupin superfamily)
VENPKIVKAGNVESWALPGATGENAGFIRRVAYPHTVGAKQLFFGIAEINPGFSNHRWHRHTHDKAGGFEAGYPDGFEEITYIISGSGVVQWKTEDGRTEEEKVTAGDAVFYPFDVVEHQLLNTGNEKMIVTMCGSPPLKLKLTR